MIGYGLSELARTLKLVRPVLKVGLVLYALSALAVSECVLTVLGLLSIVK